MANVEGSGEMIVGENVSLTDSDIFVAEGALLNIASFVHLEKCKIYVRYPGAKLIINNYCSFSNDSRIFVDTSIEIGQYCLIGANCFISDSQVHSLNYLERRKAILSRWEDVWEAKPRTTPVIIGSDVWLGHSSIVLVGKGDKLEIGSRSVIGAGSVVKDSIPPDSLAVGNPAVVKKKINLS